MKNGKLLEYKGYFGSCEIDPEDDILYGKVEFIKDLVSYEGHTAKSIKESFIEAVDDYLDMCKSQGKEPDKPFKGSLNIRIGEEIHKALSLKSISSNKSVNAIIKEALRKQFL